jgi:hypothetical protein
MAGAVRMGAAQEGTQGMVGTMTTNSPTLWRPETDLVSAAVDHVRLSYHYLDGGDVDGYCSLFDERAVLRAPGSGQVNGRDELERIEASRGTSRFVRHTVREVFGSGRRVAALGRMRTVLPGAGGDSHVDFVDVFAVADSGLLADRTTFLFTPPARPRSDHP